MHNQRTIVLAARRRPQRRPALMDGPHDIAARQAWAALGDAIDPDYRMVADHDPDDVRKTAGVAPPVGPRGHEQIAVRRAHLTFSQRTDSRPAR